MTALSADRNTPERDGKFVALGVAASEKIWAGALVGRNASGLAVEATASAALAILGRAEARADNTGGLDSAITVTARRGVFRFVNSASTDEIVAADIGKRCWLVDDQTVAKTPGVGVRPVAGTVLDVDSLGVWVLVGYGPEPRKTFVPATVDTLVGTGVYRVVAPVAGAVTKIWSILEGALTTGNATLTGKIGATAITGGVITITQAASAAGDVDSAAPTAANVVAEGDGLSVTVGGTNDAVVKARVLFEITH